MSKANAYLKKVTKDTTPVFPGKTIESVSHGFSPGGAGLFLIVTTTDGDILRISPQGFDYENEFKFETLR